MPSPTSTTERYHSTFGSDLWLSLAAIFLYGLSAVPLLGWFKNLAALFPYAPNPSSALATPITILFQAPGPADTGSAPALVWIPLLLALVLAIAALVPLRHRRLVIILLGVIGLAVLAVLFVQLGRNVTAAGQSGIFRHIGIGQYVFGIGSVTAIAAGILTPSGKPKQVQSMHEAGTMSRDDAPVSGTHDRR